MQGNMTPALRPHDFMRARHPDYFPDSGEAPARLTRDKLDYEIDALGAREQVQEFAQFARWIAQLEISPDLKPAPGSGADNAAATGESSLIAFRAAAPEGTPPESWGFAFSTAKEWAHAAREGCAFLASLPEAVQKIHFVTSRSAPASERDDLTRHLSSEHDIAVEILDRAWLVDRVFSGERQRQAAELLGIDDALEVREKSDATNKLRVEELDVLLRQLAAPAEIHGDNAYALALDYLRAARLARTLGLPRAEVETLLQGAEDVAGRSPDPTIRVRALYEHAWTALFWHDDCARMLSLYLDLEKLLPEVTRPRDLELAHTLLLTLYSAVSQGCLTDKEVVLETRAQRLRSALEAIASDHDRPSAAAYASLILATGFSPTWISDEEEADSRLQLVAVLLEKVLTLPDVPVLALIDHLQDIEFAYVRLPAYEDLREAMRALVRDRSGDAAEGELLLRSGSSLVTAGLHLAALDTLGKARALLTAEDSADFALRASLAAADAYQGLALYWAARMEALSVVSHALRTMEQADELSLEATFALRRMSDCELRLGRVRAFLAWHLACRVVADGIMAVYYDTDLLTEWGKIQDGVFSVFLMNLAERSISSIAALEKTFVEAHLDWSRWALLCRTGRESEVLAEIPADVATDADGLDEWMARVSAQPARDQMTPLLQHVDGETWLFSTDVLGVRFAVVCPDVWPLVLIAENLMGVLEVALSTADWSALAIVVEEVTIGLSATDGGQNPPHIDVNEPPRGTRYELEFAPDVEDWLKSPAARAPMREFVEQFLHRLLADITIDPLDELKVELDRWHTHETFSRALATSPTAPHVTTILGDDPYALS